MSMIDEFNNKSIIPTEFNTSSTFKAPIIDSTSQIPIIVKTKSQQPTVYGDAARDAFLQLQIDNETGHYLTLHNQENEAILTLWSKSGKALSSVNLVHELPSILGVQDKYLYVDFAGNLSWKEIPGGGGQGPVSMLFGTTEYWNNMPSLRSKIGTIYVYTDKDQIINPDGSITYVPGIKIGDNNAYLINKPFLTTAVEIKLLEHIENVMMHIQPGERERWNNKLNYIDPGETDLLTFTRN